MTSSVIFRPDSLQNETKLACCSGLCIDLLKELADKLSFTFELFEVEDKKWGGIDSVSMIYTRDKYKCLSLYILDLCTKQ